MLCATLACAALFVSEARGLPAGMTLPATYRMSGPVVTTVTMTFRGQTRTVTQRSRARDTLTVYADGTFTVAGFVGDGQPATGTWTETAPNRFARAYAADVGPRMETVLSWALSGLPGLRNADVNCSLFPGPVRIRLGGNRLDGIDRMRFSFRGNRVRGHGNMVVTWRCTRTD
jgi:hypothetical protein